MSNSSDIKGLSSNLGGSTLSREIRTTSSDGGNNQSASKVAITQPPTTVSNLVVDTAHSLGSKQVSTGRQEADSTVAPAHVSDASSQLRSTLAIGQIIASNRPTAGSRLIASELRHLSKSIQVESASIRDEIANLSDNLAKTLKIVMEEDREHRNITSGNIIGRRPMFGHFTNRRFPVFRRRQGIGRASVGTNTPMNNSPADASGSDSVATTNVAVANKSILSNTSASKQISTLPARSTTARKTFTLFKDPWMTNERSASAYDGEVDTDSTDTSPGSTP